MSLEKGAGVEQQQNRLGGATSVGVSKGSRRWLTLHVTPSNDAENDADD